MFLVFFLASAFTILIHIILLDSDIRWFFVFLKYTTLATVYFAEIKKELRLLPKLIKIRAVFNVLEGV